MPDETGLLPLTAAKRAELARLRRENASLKSEREILKKRGLLREGVDEVTRFAFIDALRGARALSLPLLCQADDRIRSVNR